MAASAPANSFKQLRGDLRSAMWPPRQVADAEPRHEGRDDERRRVHVAAGEEDQQALPDDLIHQRRRP